MAIGVAAIVVAGGVGSRMGTDFPKQLAPLGPKRVLDWSVDAVAAVSEHVVVVAHPDLLAEHQSPGASQVVPGGPTRADSVRSGLAAVADLEPRYVLIHDAARPVVDRDLVDRVIGSLTSGNDAVVPVVPVTDSLRRVSGGSVDRSQFRAVQTPQGFEFGLIQRAHASGNDATDDASLVDLLGEEVAHVDGDQKNIKITVAADLALAEILLR